MRHGQRAWDPDQTNKRKELINCKQTPFIAHLSIKWLKHLASVTNMVKFNCFYDEQKIHHEWWGPVSQYFSTEVTKFGLKCIMPIAHSHTHTHSTHILIKNARKCLNIGCLKLKTTPVTSTKVRPLKWRLLLYVQSYHVIKIEHTMIIICCLLPCGFWDVEWMQIFCSSLGCTLNLVYFFCITCIDDKKWSAACIVSNSDEIFWTDYEHARSAICSPAHTRYIAKF